MAERLENGTENKVLYDSHQDKHLLYGSNNIHCAKVNVQINYRADWYHSCSSPTHKIFNVVRGKTN
jgi:hypothetical protein